MKDLAVAVVADGTPDFSQEEGPGKDTGANNGVVRSLDTVDYEVSWQVTKDGDYVLEAELPAGVEFAPGSDSFCNNAGSAIKNDLTYKNKNTLRCELTGKAGQSVKSAVKVFVRRAANDSVIPLQFTAGGVTSNKVSTTVSAKPDFNVGFSVFSSFAHNVAGGRAEGSFHVTIKSPRPDTGLNKGLEALTGDYTVRIPAPDLPADTQFECFTTTASTGDPEAGDTLQGFVEDKWLRPSGVCPDVKYEGGVITYKVTGADLTASSWPTIGKYDRPYSGDLVTSKKISITVPLSFTADAPKTVNYGNAEITATTLSGQEYVISSPEGITQWVDNMTIGGLRSDPVYFDDIEGLSAGPGLAKGQSNAKRSGLSQWFAPIGQYAGKNVTSCMILDSSRTKFATGTPWGYSREKPKGHAIEYYRGNADVLTDGFSCGLFGDGTEGWSTDAGDLSGVKAFRVVPHEKIGTTFDTADMSLGAAVERLESDTSPAGTELPVRFMTLFEDGTKIHDQSSYFTAVDGTFGLNPAWDKADGLFGQVRNLNLGFTAKDGLNSGTVTATLPACLKVTNPGTGTLTVAADGVDRENCGIPGDTVSFPVVDGAPNYVVQAQVMAKSPQTGTTKVILDSVQQPLSEVRRSKSISFTTGLVEQATASVSTSAPENTVTLENGTAAIPFTLSWGNATTGNASGELVWQVPGNVTLATVGTPSEGASVQCTTQDRGEVTAALAADKSGKTLTWAACPADTAGLAGVTGLKVSTGTLAPTATGTLPVSVTANTVGDVNTSFTAGVFTTTGDGKVELTEATPISVYVRDPAPEDTVTESAWEDATDQNAKNCDTKQVTQTRTVTMTPHKWDPAGKQWVADPDHATTKTETQTRDMTDSELQVCTPKPADKVDTAEWVDQDGADAKNCAAKTVTQTRSKTTTPYKWDTVTKTWVLDADKVKVESETQTRPMNDTELMACAIRPADKIDTTEWVDSTAAGAKDCAAGKVIQTRSKTTTPYKWDTVAHEYVLDTENAVTTTETQTRDMSDAELQVCTPKPADKVDTTEWVDSTDEGAKDCAAGKVKQSRSVTTTPYKWDAATKKWVLDTDKAVTTTETQARDMTDSELQECTVNPGVKVEETEWADSAEDGAKDCATRKVTQTRTVTTTPYKWDTAAKKWVLDPENATSVTESQVRDMNEDEVKVCMAGTGVPVYPDPTPVPPGGKIIIDPINGPDNPAQCEPTGPITRADGVTITVDKDCKVTITIPEGKTPGLLTPPVEVTPKYPTPDKPVVTVPVKVIDTPDWDDTTTTPDTPVTIEKRKGEIPEGTKTEVTGPGTAVLNPDGSITVTPNEDAKPGEKITVKVVDKVGNPLDNITVTITEPKPGPDWDDSITGPGKKITVPNKGGDVPGGTTVTVNGPGTATLNPDGSITVTPNEGAKPGEKITITVNDGEGKVLDSFTVKIGKPKTTTKNLPVTGATTTGLAGLAAVFMLAGGLMAWRRRRN
ncbi:Ig-like domain-containing protein [Actinotignum sp. GS-2025c]|uniref:Ig-like domain-containing protein n=1 Tax=Actinotignum sp. GS-2025c TaxID=3427276 RepID=UPI003F481810